MQNGRTSTYHSLVVLAFLHELAYLCFLCSFPYFLPLQLNDLHPHVVPIMTLETIKSACVNYFIECTRAGGIFDDMMKAI
jgi:hypothetical protein